MSGPDWCRWYPSKWLAGTNHLTLEQRGVYIQVVTVIMDLGECDASDRYLAKLCNCNRQRARRIVNELISMGKLYESCGKLRQNRAETERKVAEKFSEMGKKRAAKRWNANGLDDASPQWQPKPQPHIDSESPTDSESPERIYESVGVRTTASHNGDAAKSKRGSRLPRDWRPSEQDTAEAHRLGLTGNDAEREADKFRDYWIAQPGQRGVKADWPATWRNWCRKAAGDRPRKSEETWGLY